jgi:putative sigma-54 modulation protein
MDVQIKAHTLKLTDELRQYIEKRVTKLDRVNERVVDAKFEIREEPHHLPPQRFVAQFTIQTRRAILRAEEKNAEVHAAVDLVTDKMARQIRRFHDRKVHRSRREAINLGMLAANQSEEIAEPEPDEDVFLNGAIVRSKRFQVQPMDTAEAIEQLELLGHDFFIYHNLDTNQMNVVYRRKDGRFGLLQPELA